MVKEKKQKKAGKQLDLVAQTVLQNKVRPDESFNPQKVTGSIVTSEQITCILNEINLMDHKEENTISSKNKPNNKISLSGDVILDGMRIDEYSRAVIESVLSQLLAGNYQFTASMLSRTMTGSSDQNFVSAEQRSSIEAVMEKCMFTPFRIAIDVPDMPTEMNTKYLGPIIPAIALEANISGQKSTAYQITTMPALYKLCVETNNIAVTPISLLSIPNMSYTRRNLSILNTLQRAIAHLLYPAEGEYVQPDPLELGYEALYEMASDYGVVKSTRTFNQRVRESVRLILDSWVTTGYLDRWEDITVQRMKIIGVRIYFPPFQPNEKITLENGE